MAIESNNFSFGFYGTLENSHSAKMSWNPDEAWQAMMEQALSLAMMDEEEARDFLDSRIGRKLADEIVNLGGSGKVLETINSEAGKVATRSCLEWYLEL